MMRTYLAVAIGVIVFGAYWTGTRVGRAKCMTDVANNGAHAQIQTIKIQGKINAEVFNTTTADIRRVLRTQYTIAD